MKHRGEIRLRHSTRVSMYIMWEVIFPVALINSKQIVRGNKGGRLRKRSRPVSDIVGSPSIWAKYLGIAMEGVPKSHPELHPEQKTESQVYS